MYVTQIKWTSVDNILPSSCSIISPISATGGLNAFSKYSFFEQFYKLLFYKLFQQGVLHQLKFSWGQLHKGAHQGVKYPWRMLH